MAIKSSRPLSNSLRVLIAAGSIGAFLGGWALFAHSPNPYENAQAAGSDAPVQNSSNTQLPVLPTPRSRTLPGSRQSQPRQKQQQQTGPQLLPDTQPQQTGPQLQPGTQPQPSTLPFGQQRRMRTGGS